MAFALGRRVRLDVAKYLLGQTPAATAATVYAGFSTTNPGDDGQAIAEPTIGVGGYARAVLTPWATAVLPSVGVPVVLAPTNNVTWTATAAWSTGTSLLNYVVLWSATTGTTEAVYIGSTPLQLPLAVNASMSITMLATDFSISVGAL